MRVRQLLPALSVLAASIAVASAAAASAAGGAGKEGGQGATTAIVVQAVDSPRSFVADDGRTHIEYDLLVTNGLPPAVTLRSLTVRARGRPLLNLRGNRLAAQTHALGGIEPTRTVAGASAVAIVVDVILPRGTRVPDLVGNTIRYAVAPSPIGVAISSHTVHGPRLRVERRKPIVIAPPLRGPGWLDANGCCAPDAPHRSTLAPTNGTLVPIETFAIDWARLRDGVISRGDGAEPRDYIAFGARIHSVAAGRVVSAVDNLPEEPINADPIAPGVEDANQFDGNSAVIKIGPGEYALYAHMQPGSVRVEKGQRVRTGQVIGRLGNSGNSSSPHLHFSIQDGPNPRSTVSLPYVFDRFRARGRAEIGPTGPPGFVISGRPHRASSAYPLIQTVADFPR